MDKLGVYCSNHKMQRNYDKIKLYRPGWKRVTVSNDLIPHNLEEHPLHIYLQVRPAYADQISSSLLSIPFFEPQDLKPHQFLNLQLKFEREGLFFHARSTICPPLTTSYYDFIRCPMLNDGWLLSISKQADNLKLDCNKHYTVSMKTNRNRESCSASEARRNFAWTRFQFGNLYQNIFTLYYKIHPKGNIYIWFNTTWAFFRSFYYITFYFFIKQITIISEHNFGKFIKNIFRVSR